MSCQRRFFEAFLVIYTLLGILLVVAAVNFQAANGSQISREGLNFIYGALGWMFVTIILYLIAYIRVFAIFPIPVVLLAVGIVGEAVTVTIIGVLREEIDVKTRESTLIVLGTITGCLIPLQIFGVLISIVHYRRNQKDFLVVASK
jgi:hypothetical protein